MNKDHNILIACECSGVVRDAFLRAGFNNTYSCDILPSESEYSDNHYQSDVRPFLKLKWDLLIAHPPCCYLTRAGGNKYGRNVITPADFIKQRWALDFFKSCLYARAACVAVENPVMLRFPDIPRYNFSVEPYHFGHYPYTKKTCFWTKNLPDLVPKFKHPPENPISWCDKKRNPAERTRTFRGIAEGMANQWGCWLINRVKNGRYYMEGLK